MSPLAAHAVTMPTVETPELIGEIAVRLEDHMIVEIARALGLDIELETIDPAVPDNSEE